MKKTADRVKESDMLAEYDFRAGVKGKYVARFKGKTNDVVALAPDVAELFQDSKSVNDALRIIAKLADKQSRKTAAG